MREYLHRVDTKEWKGMHRGSKLFANGMPQTFPNRKMAAHLEARKASWLKSWGSISHAGQTVPGSQRKSRCA